MTSEDGKTSRSQLWRSACRKMETDEVGDARDFKVRAVHRRQP